MTFRGLVDGFVTYFMKRNRVIPFFIVTFCLFAFSTAAFSDQLIVEPDSGRAPILAAIRDAASSIQLVMYGLTDQAFINALIAAKSQHPQILLEKCPYHAKEENANAIRLLQQNGITLHWPNPHFQLTHQKTFLFDHKQALIMTFNLTYSAFTKERNFALFTSDPLLVQEIEKVFAADWEHQEVAVNQAHLVWCPLHCRERVLTLIQQARHSIQIYAQDLSDYQMTGALAAAAKSGVHVQLLLSSTSNQPKNKKRFAYLTRAGVKIHFNQQYIIHAKVIIIDQQRALLGSLNLTAPSMDDNRELSILITEKASLQTLLNTFTHDWKH